MVPLLSAYTPNIPPNYRSALTTRSVGNRHRRHKRGFVLVPGPRGRALLEDLLPTVVSGTIGGGIPC
jgi:hypothetical protein